MKFLYGLLSFFSRTANIVAFLLLIASGAAAKVNPDYFWPLGLLGLAYPFLALLNIFFVISWMIRKRFFFLISLIGLAVTFPQLKAQIAIPFLQKKTEAAHDIRVMNYNVRNFDLYNWSNNQKSWQSMMDTIKSYDPDFLLIQEYYTDQNKFKNTEYLESIGYKHHQFAIELVRKGTDCWGVALFSKYPIVESGELIRQQTPSPYGNFHNRSVYADVVVKNQRIRIISAHLQSIYLGYDDYSTIKEIKDDKPSHFRKVIPIIKKLGKAYKQRGIQAAELRAFIEESPYPVILGGDFNDTPGSFAYQQMEQILDDAFIEKGKGLGSTYNGIIPLLRIDYIFKDRTIECTNFHLIKNPNSDHFPIAADFILPDKDSLKTDN